MYESGVELFSLDANGARFRVWYVTGTEDAVELADVAPADGIPDFVAEVGRVAEDTHVYFTDDLRFRRPEVDTDYLAPADAGGDRRFDIYLRNLVGAGGSYEVDACQDVPDRCAGHLVMDNDFEGFSYPSDAIAIRARVSHEYFHAIQNAYSTGQDAKWTEGTAVWAAEKMYPEQDDYERLIRAFLEEPFRAFDRPSGPSSGDDYPYGAALWPTFLDERFGPDTVRHIWEATEDPERGTIDFLLATEEILKFRYYTALEEAWLEFTRWNLFTGDRADPTRSYASSADWGQVALEPLIEASDQGLFETRQQTEGISARYTPIDLPDLGGEPRRLSMTTDSGAPAVGTAYLWQDGVMGEAMPLEPDPAQPERATLELAWQGSPRLFLVVTGVSQGEPMRTVTVSMSDLSEPGGGCSIATDRAPRQDGLLVLVLAAALVCLSRRRRTDSCPPQHPGMLLPLEQAVPWPDTRRAQTGGVKFA